MAIVLDGTNGITTPSYGGADTAEYLVPVTGFKNRIINGAMVIAQRGTSTSLTTATKGYSPDRFGCYVVTSGATVTVSQSSTAPTGFNSSLLYTVGTGASLSATDFNSISQLIEGYNIADLGWGTANAKTVTLSFWVRSSITGTYGVTFRNDDASRGYGATYTISVANTWEQKTITVAGDTSGTWLTTNGIGLNVTFGLGVGATYSSAAGSWGAGAWGVTGATNIVATSGATFYLTGVQLEVGSTATSFDYLDYGRSLIQCQRYYFKIKPASNSTLNPAGFNSNTTLFSGFVQFPVTMRIAPTTLEQSGTATDYQIVNASGATNCSSVPTLNDTTVDLARTSFTVASGLTAGHGGAVRSGTSNGFLAWSAEL